MTSALVDFLISDSEQDRDSDSVGSKVEAEKSSRASFKLANLLRNFLKDCKLRSRTIAFSVRAGSVVRSIARGPDFSPTGPQLGQDCQKLVRTITYVVQ